MFLSVFGIRIILALQNELESISSSFISWKDIIYLNILFAPFSFSSLSAVVKVEDGRRLSLNGCLEQSIAPSHGPAWD